MNPWLPKMVVLLGNAALVALRAPHGHRSRRVAVVRSLRSKRELLLLTFAWSGFLIPLVWVATPWLAFADYPLRPLPLVAGIVCLVVGLWYFARAHADLGAFWSPTLEVREAHRLVTDGVYHHVRHPMYTSLLLYSLGQWLALPNRVAGPAYAVAMVLLCALRLDAEEHMLREEFGSEYDRYAARTKRLVPGVW